MARTWGSIVRSGWGDEGEGQQGLAHLVAHLAFSGTPGPDREMPADVSPAGRLGLPPGAGQHVATSVGFTAYALELPAAVGDVAETALDVLREWSSANAFDPAQVERERRAVLAEMRQGSARAAARQTDARRSAPGDAAAAQVSASAEGVVEKATSEQLSALYRSWYRPERMAVIASGDLEPKRVEGALRERFGRIKGAGIRP